MRTSLCGKLHNRLPSGVFNSCPRTLLSPLALITVGAQHWVIVVVRSPNDCLVNAIQALYQASFTKYNGAPRNCEALILYHISITLLCLYQNEERLTPCILIQSTIPEQVFGRTAKLRHSGPLFLEEMALSQCLINRHRGLIWTLASSCLEMEVVLSKHDAVFTV